MREKYCKFNVKQKESSLRTLTDRQNILLKFQ